MRRRKESCEKEKVRDGKKEKEIAEQRDRQERQDTGRGRHRDTVYERDRDERKRKKGRKRKREMGLRGSERFQLRGQSRQVQAKYSLEIKDNNQKAFWIFRSYSLFSDRYQYIPKDTGKLGKKFRTVIRCLLVAYKTSSFNFSLLLNHSNQYKVARSNK